MSLYKKLDLTDVRTYSVRKRNSQVVIDAFGRPHVPQSRFGNFIGNLPNMLKAADLTALVDLIVQARQQDKPVALLMGAHVIKVGLNPIIIDAMQTGIITSVAINGAGCIHDTELAYFGATSENVAEGLETGLFGMATETATIINETIHHGAGSDKGFGELMGERLAIDHPPYGATSLLANAFPLQLPVTVHVAIGTDIVHQHPSTDAAAIGLASYLDFKVFAQQLCGLRPGAVVLLFGSAVLLPEVFLKALTVVRNLGYPAREFISANFDMISHYRPRVNVLQRPTHNGGRCFEFIGHHEIMIPLLFAAINEKLNESSSR